VKSKAGVCAECAMAEGEPMNEGRSAIAAKANIFRARSQQCLC